MRILLDECVPRKLKQLLTGHACLTVPEAGFSGAKNGQLLRQAELAGFEVFLTLDKGLEYQQSLRGRAIAVLIVRARSNRLKDLEPQRQACRLALQSIGPGDVIVVSNQGADRLLS